MTSERVLLRFFDVGDFFVDFDGGIEGSEGVSKDRIGPIASIEASEALGKSRDSVFIVALAIAMSAYRNAREIRTLHTNSRQLNQYVRCINQ